MSRASSLRYRDRADPHVSDFAPKGKLGSGSKRLWESFYIYCTLYEERHRVDIAEGSREIDRADLIVIEIALLGHSRSSFYLAGSME